MEPKTDEKGQAYFDHPRDAPAEWIRGYVKRIRDEFKKNPLSLCLIAVETCEPNSPTFSTWLDQEMDCTDADLDRFLRSYQMFMLVSEFENSYTTFASMDLDDEQREFYLAIWQLEAARRKEN
jgi:hypothetical protein